MKNKTLANKLKFYSQHVEGSQLKELLENASVLITEQEKTINDQEQELNRSKRLLKFHKAISYFP